MARIRIAVAIVLPEPVRSEVDVLRRAIGADDLDRVPPHVTLVPPINLRECDLPAALLRLRAAARAVDECQLSFGPVESFAPVTPTIHLAVNGDLRALQALQREVFQTPLWRQAMYPFHPHVTLRVDAPDGLIASARNAMAGYRATAAIDRIVMLREERSITRQRQWVPFADALLKGVRVVGTGGLAVELCCSTILDPEAVTQLAAVIAPLERGEIVVTARREGEVVGILAGDALVVRPDAERQGIANLLQNELRWRSSTSG